MEALVQRLDEMLTSMIMDMDMTGGGILAVYAQQLAELLDRIDPIGGHSRTRDEGL